MFSDCNVSDTKYVSLRWLDRNGAQGIISQFLKHLGTPKLSGSLRLLHSFLEANPSLLCFSLSRFSLLCRSSSSLSLLTKTQGFFSSNATLALSPDLRRTPSLLCFEVPPLGLFCCKMRSRCPHVIVHGSGFTFEFANVYESCKLLVILVEEERV
ncbi:hypothetical protein Rs2_14495 [Raphanus sativus]|nr:hypothetical protein Rs2_14495 [Raphanus sativus]